MENLKKRPSISLLLKNGQARISPMGFFPSATFDKYLASFSKFSSTFEKKEKAHYIPLVEAKAYLELIRSEGFLPNVSPQLTKEIHTLGVEDSREDNQHYQWIIDDLASRELAPRPLQKEAVRIMSKRRSFLLLDEMGVGKTIEALCSIPKEAPVLCVVPAIVKINWKEECEKWRPDLSPVQLKGRNSFRWPRPREMVITNYEILPRAVRRGPLGYCIPEEFGSPEKGTVLIMDEVHKAKSTSAQRTRSLKGIKNHVKRTSGKVFGLTGTPLINHPAELWNVAQVCDVAEEAFGTWENYVRIMRGSRQGYGNSYIWQTPPMDEAITSLQRVSLRRTLEMAAPEMPPITHETVTISIDKQTKEACDKAMEALNAIGISLEDAMDDAMFTKDQDLAWKEISRARKQLSLAKMPTVMKYVDEYKEAEEPLIVMSAMRGPAEAVSKRDKWGAIMGGVSHKQRDTYVKAFQNGDLEGLGITMSAGGVGITLTRGSHILAVDSSWTPADNQQAIARIRRIGQTRPQTVVWIVADHELDRKVHHKVMLKLNFIETSVEATTSEIWKGEESSLGTNIQIKDHKEPNNRTFQQPRRGPFGETEEWAAEAIAKLAKDDEDYALINNNLGFSRVDSPVGHSLVRRLDVGLTESEWSRCVAMAKRYPAQVGEPPAE